MEGTGVQNRRRSRLGPRTRITAQETPESQLKGYLGSLPRHDHGAQPGFTAPIVIALGGFPGRRMGITPDP